MNIIFKTIINLFALFMFICCFGNCKKLKDEKLSLPRRNYTGNELRIDGYYWRNNINQDGIVAYFLYSNGIIRTCGSSNSFQEFENNINTLNTSTSKAYKEEWGVFIVENNIIKYEVWRGSRWLEPRPLIIYEGKILNDTTFHITLSHRQDGSERSEKNEIYHFRQFSPKPDSTNNFIK